VIPIKQLLKGCATGLIGGLLGCIVFVIVWKVILRNNQSKIAFAVISVIKNGVCGHVSDKNNTGGNT